LFARLERCFSFSSRFQATARVFPFFRPVKIYGRNFFLRAVRALEIPSSVDARTTARYGNNATLRFLGAA
jgi:hypothetical protein